MSEPPIFKPHGLRFGPPGEGAVHVVVDMQRLFHDPTGWHTPWFGRVLPRVAALVAAAPERTIFTRFIPPRAATDLGGSWQRYYARWPQMTRDRLDPALLDLVPELAMFAPPAQIVDKPLYSPWFGRGLSDRLQAAHADTLIVSGAETEVCVLATVLGAIDHGYRVIIATDAICSSADPTHDAMLEIYHNRFGLQVETADTAELIVALGGVVTDSVRAAR